MFLEFINEYGTTILYAIVTGVAGYIGLCIKSLYTKYVNDKTKADVVKTCVKAVEQLYKDLHGEDKYNEVVKSASEMLALKGISITELEIKMLIEAAVAEFNNVFENGVPSDIT
ncbi:MAG: phage holin family protein [Clostridia bacterium]|nr:phage holin family protein [Clostridia bacterium]